MDSRLAALRSAIDAVGGQSALARLLHETFGLKVQQGHVWHWVHKSRKAPAEYTLAIEHLSGISRRKLRPDVFILPRKVNREAEGLTTQDAAQLLQSPNPRAPEGA